MGLTSLDGGKPCDCCSSAAALLFCRAHAAFMCLACDSRLHAAADGHQRVWLCSVCERAPAAVTCRADAAALCVACDRDIHSANPLARRHDRAPVVPFYDTADALLAPAAGDFVMETLIPDSKLPAVDTEVKPEFYFPDSDNFLDFDNYQISESLVPVQTGPVKHPVPTETRFEIDFSSPNPVNLYNTQSLSLSVSSSSVDGGIVPDGGGGALSESSYPYPRTMSSQADREARVLRYKEKRRNRKFEKTIRYASRKAYAETRPRIRGRFVKRTDSESDIYGTLPGVVPSYIVN